MEMTLRWYGSKFDTVTLKQIRQIPGVGGVITTLYDTKPGEVWSRERIRAMIDEVEAAGLHVAGIESVNVHDAIKAGLPERNQYIANYIKTLENLGKEGIHLVCYNFMPVFDMYEIMRALYVIDFRGPIRPDHGRMIWDEVAMPGYGCMTAHSGRRI